MDDRGNSIATEKATFPDTKCTPHTHGADDLIRGGYWYYKIT